MAIPILLRKYLHHRGDYRDILGKPVATHGISNAIKPMGIEGYTAVADCRPGCRGVLVVLDADDECVLERAIQLNKRIEKTIQHPFAIALAERTYEDWLYSSIESLELSEQSYIHDVNGMSRIKAALPEKYVKPVWQPRLTDRIDISLATSRNKSLARMLNRFQSLIEGV